MGYDVERFVGYVNEGLLCCVCRDVLERPLQAPCEHAYCSACISSWLLHHHSCPEDRLPLDVGSLKPLHRYMRNDLSRLQIRCVNAGQGCEVICSLESLHLHEDDCEFSFTSCLNTGCPVQVERQRLKAHLSKCNFRNRKFPNGCGLTLLSTDQSQPNCVAELRKEVEMLRAEMRCKVEEVRREMEYRLDSHRRHTVQKESQLRNEVEELKGQLSLAMCDIQALLAEERLSRQELADAKLEKRELLELFKELQSIRNPHPVQQGAKDQRQGNQQTTPRRELTTKLTKHLQREASSPASRLSLHLSQPIKASSQVGEGVHMGGTQNPTQDCIKKKNQEVTVI